MSRSDPEHADHLFELLRRVHELLAQEGIWHCLLYGTLLGAVRDGDIIRWDHDLDLLVRPADVPRIVELHDGAGRTGLWFWESVGTGMRLALNPDRIPYFELGNVGIMEGEHCFGELWAPVLFADGVLRCYDLEREVAYWPRAAVPAFVVEQLAEATIRGRPFPVPAHAEQLLTWHYGSDWRIPYRSVRDGGVARTDRTDASDVAEPQLAERIRWCEQRGWDRSVYRDQPAWPRDIRAAGPRDRSPRTATSSGSEWWRTLEEIRSNY